MKPKESAKIIIKDGKPKLVMTTLAKRYISLSDYHDESYADTDDPMSAEEQFDLYVKGKDSAGYYTWDTRESEMDIEIDPSVLKWMADNMKNAEALDDMGHHKTR